MPLAGAGAWRAAHCSGVHILRLQAPEVILPAVERRF